MRYTELGTTGIKASVISFGGIPIQRVSVEEAAEILSACKESGINLLIPLVFTQTAKKRSASILKDMAVRAGM